MSPERLRQIEELFHAVREGSAERQAALLARADPELRREVESLLGRQSENLFLDRAAVEASGQYPQDPACSMLSAGTFLGPYRVEGKLGEGGMGEVYRARDTRLKRDVAVKVLPRTFARDTDRCARFRREAELLATLNHAHIAALYGLEEAGDLTALVLELVEGPTLADRLIEGAVPLDEALAIARQIAEAFEAAHEKGIIHRDLKPANIKVRPDGTVKVLDFGLAKSLEPTGAPSILSELPSTALSPAPTLAGMILGTPSYMSPEQARGRAVDERTDIWAFGCVLYEMLSGKKPFPGETVTDIVAAIINNEPDWQALPHRTPERIQSLIARCLRKDPAQRLRDIADGRFQIEEVLNDPRASTAAVTQARSAREWAAWVTAALFLGTTLFVATRPSTTASSRDSISFPVYPPEKTEFSARTNSTFDVPSFALSPDGHALVFSAAMPGARPMLWLRSLDHVDARQLAGTEDGQDPFWSPDNSWIGFFASGTLRKIPAAGGAVKVIQTMNDIRGATWGTRETILLGTGGQGIVSMNPEGGAITPVTVVDASLHENTHRNPSFLPDGLHFLYSVIGDSDRSGVYVGSVDGKTKRLLLHVLTSAVYAPPGYLLYVDGDRLLGQAFDTDRLELKGQPFFVAEYVGRSSSFMSGVSAALTGAIAHARPIAQHGRLAWIDRRGNPLDTIGTPDGDYTDFRLSPDETRLAASLVDPKTNAVDIWIRDLASGRNSRVGSGGGVTAAAVWSPDGTRLVFRSNRTGVIELYERSAAGGGIDRRVLPSDADRANPPGLTATDWSADGRWLLSGAGGDLWLIPLVNDLKAEKFFASPAVEEHGNFSPDGHLVAYTSNESGRFEVYVETVPRSDQKLPVSTNGGYEPRWRADGSEIYYLSEDRNLMAVPVSAGSSSGIPKFGIPKPLFQAHVPAGVSGLRTHYVPSRDGQRFLVNMATDTAASPITVVLNWSASLNK